MANPGLESFGEYTQACVTNSSRPPEKLKGKENPDLPLVFSNYWPPNVALFLFLPFGTFNLSAMQVCDAQEICQAHS